MGYVPPIITTATRRALLDAWESKRTNDVLIQGWFKRDNEVLYNYIDKLADKAYQSAPSGADDILLETSSVMHELFRRQAKADGIKLPCVTKDSLVAFLEEFWNPHDDYEQRILRRMRDENRGIVPALAPQPRRLLTYKWRGVAVVYGAIVHQGEVDLLDASFAERGEPERMQELRKQALKSPKEPPQP